MSYRTVLFDADNTLLDFTRSEHEALRDCLRARGLPCGKHVTEGYAAINDRHWKRLERGLTTREALRVARFEDFCREYGFGCDPRQLADDYFDTLCTKSYLIDGALELCERLHGQARLYLITNGNTKVQNGRFNPSPLAPLFEAVFISEDMGCAKPSKAYFDAVAAAIPEFDPADTLVVGDSLSSDIQGGINAGLATCWYNPHGKTAPADMKIDYTVRSLDEIPPIVLN
jgi:2-haloacid dehalogenase